MEVKQMFLKEPKWTSKEVDAGGNPISHSTDDNTPFIAFVGKVDGTNSIANTDSSPFFSDKENIRQFNYEDLVDGKLVIRFQDHKKGYLFRKKLDGLFTPTDGSVPTGRYKNLIIPRVKTYSQVSGSSTEYEEVYDSASIDVTTGDVTLTLSTAAESYLIVIY